MTSHTNKLEPKDVVALTLGKLSAKAIRSLKLGLGSNLPGRIAQKFSPQILSRLACQARLGVIAVSGTNGKSTTCGFISAILQKASYKISHNRAGANLITGIVATLVDQSDWQGLLDCDYCLFEVDEASLPKVAAEVPLSVVLVTNLFRDQLDRFGELDTTARLIEKGIKQNSSPCVFNADDPNVAKMAPDSKRIYYGIESVNQASIPAHEVIRELSYCGTCGGEYTYSKLFFAQLGHYQCQACGNSRPHPEVAAKDVEIGAFGSSFTLVMANNSEHIELNLPGLFNVYNALAAAAIAAFLGIDTPTMKKGLESYQTLFGRSEKLELASKSVLIQLIKNPAGASQVTASCAKDSKATLLIAINDNDADGRDISWLWDADFEKLAEHQGPLVVAGQRAEDMSVRMKYAGYPQERIIVIPHLDAALDKALEMTAAGQTLWVMPTYTCLLELQKILAARGHVLSGTEV